MNNSIIDLVSDEETKPLVKEIKSSPSRKTRKEQTQEKTKESKLFVKHELKTGAKKRHGNEPLTSPKPKKAKLETEEKDVNKCKQNKRVKNVNVDEEKVESSSGETSGLQGKLQFGADWQFENVIAQKLHLSIPVVRNVIRLFETENTIPFIARYRKEQTGHMEPEMLRRVKDNHDRLLAVKQKMNSVASSITKMNKMTPSVLSALRSSQTMNEIDHIYAQFKTSGARTLAERARALDLEQPAMTILEGTGFVNPENLVNSKTESLAKVKQGLQHIIADVISKTKIVLDTLRNLCESNKYAITVETKRTNEKVDKIKKEFMKSGQKVTTKVDEYTAEKFQIYFSFQIPIQYIKPHQVLAIYRGETLKVISVKINLPVRFLNAIQEVCYNEWMTKGQSYSFRSELLRKSVEDSYSRLMQPHMVRQIRSDLMEEAHQASIDVFAKNLKHLLLTPPVRGEVIIAIDPGFKHGCKLAVVNGNGDVLKTDVLYLHSGGNREREKQFIQSLVSEYRCELIALGNGTACRETEMWISSLINGGYFEPLKVKYTIVDEQGVSIYSCSPVAEQEFPELDPNLISAVSLARRVQDPLSELVKVEPKHLGVGMYQHDIPEKKLCSTLNEVVVECASFVGVDVNTASETLLRQVAGLNATRATNIIDWRSRNGPFLNRDQLHLVKGIGPKSFEQCAGFLRILSKTSAFVCFGDLKNSETMTKRKKKKNIASENTPNPLDQTWIHPESYATVYWFLELCGVNLSGFGSETFLNEISRKVEEVGFKNIASQANISEERLKLIIDGLKQKPDDDYRSQFQKPLFRSGVRSVEDLSVGSTVTGRVQNVTHFGAFVDVGVGHDGMIHVSQMRNSTLQVGDRVEVVIRKIDFGPRKPKIDLGLSRVL